MTRGVCVGCRQLLYPIAYPISCVLDHVLGKDHSTVFRRAELKELTKAHLATEINQQGSLSMDEVRVLNGTLGIHTLLSLSLARSLARSLCVCVCRSVSLSLSLSLSLATVSIHSLTKD